MTCPVCSTRLDSNGLAMIDLVPSSDKVKALCGLDPSFILQVASRAIDFYNFQTEMARTHDAQELEKTRHCLQHQTQQTSLAQKDLHNQLRTLKYQLEAIAAERDAQTRLVQDLQTRLDSSVAQVANSRASMIVDSPSGMQSPSYRGLDPNSDRNMGPLITRQPENMDARAAQSSMGPNPYRPNWAPSSRQSPQPIMQAESDPTYGSSRNDRRTRIFSSSSPAPYSGPMRVPMRGPNQNPAAPPPQQAIEPRITTSTPKHGVQPPILSPSTSTPRSSNQSVNPNLNPIDSSPQTGGSRFMTLGNAPPRPETPLLHRLAGISANRPRV